MIMHRPVTMLIRCGVSFVGTGDNGSGPYGPGSGAPGPDRPGPGVPGRGGSGTDRPGPSFPPSNEPKPTANVTPTLRSVENGASARNHASLRQSDRVKTVLR